MVEVGIKAATLACCSATLDSSLQTHTPTHFSHPPSSWPHYGAISWWRCQRHTVISCSSFPCQLGLLEELTTDEQREQVTDTSCNTAQQAGPDWAAPGPAGMSPLFQNNLGKADTVATENDPDGEINPNINKVDQN